MITRALQRETLLKGIERGFLQTINQAHELGMLEDLLFDIVRLFSMSTAGMLERAASFQVDLKQRDAQGNTLMHALAKAELHVLHTPAEKQLAISRDYCLWAMEVLLNHGLSLEDKNNEGKNPVELAREHSNFMFGAALGLLEIKQGNAAEHEKEGICSIL